VIAKRRKKNKSKDANLLGGIGGRPGRWWRWATHTQANTPKIINLFGPYW
jgi:hypothetical protein